jgi:hypothetical protein
MRGSKLAGKSREEPVGSPGQGGRVARGTVVTSSKDIYDLVDSEEIGVGMKTRGSHGEEDHPGSRAKLASKEAGKKPKLKRDGSVRTNLASLPEDLHESETNGPDSRRHGKGQQKSFDNRSGAGERVPTISVTEIDGGYLRMGTEQQNVLQANIIDLLGDEVAG